ncbi:UNVERIFIED_CONTAM: hypothetical protein K2H54_014232, partial [Gekko kuhli]
VGYPIFSHGNLSRALSSRTSPPLYLGADARRTEGHHSSGRNNVASARSLYPSFQTMSPVLPSGGSSLPGHGLPGYPFLPCSQAEYPSGEGTLHPFGLQAGTVAPWQRDMAVAGHPPLGAEMPELICLVRHSMAAGGIRQPMGVSLAGESERRFLSQGALQWSPRSRTVQSARPRVAQHGSREARNL